jgi:hypothetical protein
MNTATITQAQHKGLRNEFADVFGKIRNFAIELYTAHGGWFATGATQTATPRMPQPAGDTVARQRSLTDRIIVGPFCASALMADMDRTWNK